MVGNIFLIDLNHEFEVDVASLLIAATKSNVLSVSSLFDIGINSHTAIDDQWDFISLEVRTCYLN